MMKKQLMLWRKKRKGAALVMSIFVALIASIITITMMSTSQSNTAQITDNKSGTIAYYAAESGLEEVKNFFNSDLTLLGLALSATDLPDEDSPATLSNNATYWIDSLTYANNNQELIVDIIGNYGDASRKIRVKLVEDVPSIFDNYGLISDGVLTINGTKTLEMSVHGNDGLKLIGTNILDPNVVATQSDDPSADPPNTSTNPVGGYVPMLDVPEVPIDDLRDLSQEDGIFLDINQADLIEQINNAPAGSKI